MEPPSSSWIVGAEYDQSLRGRLRESLRSLGYQLDSVSYGVAGSQEVGEWIARSHRGSLSILAETYRGLVVTGPAQLVDELRGEFGGTTGES